MFYWQPVISLEHLCLFILVTNCHILHPTGTPVTHSSLDVVFPNPKSNPDSISCLCHASYVVFLPLLILSIVLFITPFGFMSNHYFPAPTGPQKTCCTGWQTGGVIYLGQISLAWTVSCHNQISYVLLINSRLLLKQGYAAGETGCHNYCNISSTCLSTGWPT